MFGNRKLRITLAALALGLCSAASAGIPSAPYTDNATRAKLNATAHLMAGLPDSRAPFAQTAAWKEHSAFMRSAWSRLNGRQVAAMTAWRDAELGKACPAGGTEGAHQIANTGTEELRYLAVSTMRSPEVYQYPNSSKFGLAATLPPTKEGAPRSLVFFGSEGQSAGYWAGE